MSDAPSTPLARFIPSSLELRSQLEDAVRRDLLGPASGPEEELADEGPRFRYLVGMLAPKKAASLFDGAEPLGVAGTDTAEEGTSDHDVAVRESLGPSSVGMTFTVDGDAGTLKVVAGYGRYERVRSERLPEGKQGEPPLVWKRVPMEGVVGGVRLAEGALGPWSPVPAQPEVKVTGRARKQGEDWIVSLFLVNGQVEPEKLKDAAWLFQVELSVEAEGGHPSFVRRALREEGDTEDPVAAAEAAAMAMIYRHHVEFAVGHGVAVHAEIPAGDPTRASRISTSVMPIYDIPAVSPPTTEEVPALGGLVLDMKALGDAEPGAIPASLAALPDAYEDWVRREQARIEDPAAGLAEHAEAARRALDACGRAAARIRRGIELLGADARATEAFRFMNRAMALQRVRSVYAERVRRGDRQDFSEVDVPKNRTWFPFQIAFILLNLPGVTDLRHPDRSPSADAVADLLWFPTGGGKTEAYLGLTAYVLALRRLQGTVAGRSGEDGVAVLMRYTLRLLTLQQFQRAVTLVCACEWLRREAVLAKDLRWGRTPFRIGLWVGARTTPNKTEHSAESVKRDHGHFRRGSAVGGGGSPHQLTNCPWCGTPLDPGQHIRVEKGPSGRGRTFLFCGDPLGRCPFSAANSPDEGIPALVVDEEVYRLLPALLISTVDKFAQMPWNGVTQMLFGQVNGRCSRHGFRSPDLEDSDSHPKANALPASNTTPHAQLRPPDLIIQDELHLISGPLGTLVGLYETSVDRLMSWEVDGRTVRPKVVASTATIRRAQEQVHALFLRRVEIFPPHGTDVADSFFARQRPVGPATPGRRYVGVCALGKRLKTVFIRVYTAHLAAAQQLYERHGSAVDPWMTLVGYFNSIRELGGMRRLVEDDIRTRLRHMDQRGLARRGAPNLEELTSRKGSTDIPRILDWLEQGFNPAETQERRERRKKGERINEPLDVLLATNMLSVGVDVGRLGLMVVGGQPKTTAEYIQATSRVGRRTPGLVCAVLNWARPRDLSHYERFEHYHSTFYQHVEALSVTPFAPRALDRGLTAQLVALVRLAAQTFNGNDRAGSIDRKHALVRAAVETIVARAEEATGSRASADEVRRLLERRLDSWCAHAQRPPGGSRLGYQSKRDGVTVGLLRAAEAGEWDEFTCLNSLRDVEPTVGLVLDDHGLDDETPAGGAGP